MDAPRYSIVTASPGEALHEQAVALSADKYREHFGCRLREAYPAYLCLVRSGRPVAVCGLRRGTQRLFLQQYLDVPVARLIAHRLGEHVDERRLVELGSFAVRKRSLALPFMAAIAQELMDAGFTHAVATATLPVRRCLHGLGIHTTRLAPASAERLCGATTDWGSYYSHRPAV
ncbi:MAG: thermostable hemolysin, partial [Halieaceae bacterium]|nr:thermostable hemolysin [Halieaceae bacterium]